MDKKFWLPMAIVVGLVLLAGAPAKSSTHDFYKDKTIRFVVGFAPGGGYDLAARIVGRHISKHIPGNPTIVVENMTGDGSLIAANYTYDTARPDGLFVGIWNSGLVLRQALGDKAVRLDFRIPLKNPIFLRRPCVQLQRKIFPRGEWLGKIVSKRSMTPLCYTKLPLGRQVSSQKPSNLSIA